jgi:hypothetical protein
MTNVLSFEDAPRVVSARKQVPATGQCEVVIFPGVRFERRTDEPCESPDNKATRARKSR